MLREYLSNLANRFRIILGTTEPINAQNFEGEIENVFAKGHSTGLIIGRQEGYQDGYENGFREGEIEGLSKGKKAQYIEEYFMGAKQYLNYSIDFEPKLIIFQSNDADATIEANKPDFQVNTLNIPKMIFNVGLGFAEEQKYMVSGASVWRYKNGESTLNKVFSSTTLTNYSLNETTGKWDVSIGRADTSTANTRFVSGGVYPIQVLFVGE